jgi:hypothetical protein
LERRGGGRSLSRLIDWRRRRLHRVQKTQQVVDVQRKGEGERMHAGGGRGLGGRRGGGREMRLKQTSGRGRICLGVFLFLRGCSLLHRSCHGGDRLYVL